MRLFGKKPDSGPRMVGVFTYVDDLIGAIHSARDSGMVIDTVYAPVWHDEINEALGLKASPVRIFALVGAVTGIIIGVGLSIYTVLQWRFIVSGKPIVPLVPFVIEGFEFLILIGVFFNLFGVIVLTRLPRFRIPAWYDPRYSADRFGLVIRSDPDQKEKISAMLKQSGAESINEFAQ